MDETIDDLLDGEVVEGGLDDGRVRRVLCAGRPGTDAGGEADDCRDEHWPSLQGLDHGKERIAGQAKSAGLPRRSSLFPEIEGE
jgi:hypothetical protein